MRQRKDDYYRAALDLLAGGGVDALTIANLCARLDVTTGSFYSHFESINAFHTAFLEHWAEGRIYLLREQVDGVSDPLQRIDLLRRIAVSVHHEAESAIRGWSRTSPLVAEYQRHVDETREQVLVQAYLDAGHDSDEARVLARIGLTILVGSQQIEETVDRRRLDELLSEYQCWLAYRRQGTEVVNSPRPSMSRLATSGMSRPPGDEE